ncbi:acyl-coenzyme A thioesterase 4, mitochondrial-like isoform X2 [Prosopis cineraria]|uniref:acyl-coenzyme A thioesterase 4, mitochondrial-like isoform X2 n=1 Tax=Prosopis cineraria TaxID=364024 RepID=UPI0024105B14|nr:acyl-coenzyme A thioesterase 4, mitochondrial-like isoform X2 [Prosopis cineraria]
MQSPRVRMRRELLRSSFFFSTANAPSWNRLKTFFRNISFKDSLLHAIAGPFSNSKPSDSDSINPKPSLPVINASSSNRKPISLWPGIYHSPATQALWEARSTIFEKHAYVPSQSQLISKTPSRSRTSIFYDFASDYVLREQYRNPWNQIRMGKLVEDLDALAGTIAFKHSCNEDGTTRPLILVTASVDKMVLKKPILVDNDLTIGGAVTWVGRSSMEIQLELTQSTQGNAGTSDTQALIANFTFVARDSASGKSALINQILPETEQERFLWEEAEQRNRLRKLKRADAEYKHVQDGDTARLSALLAEGRIFSDMPALANRDSILMKDTCLENSFICQPQQRNIHGRIFGGFLMRRAFELAFSTAYVFAGAAPHFLEVDHVDFFKPVSNRFYLAFAVNPEAMKGGLRIRQVVPATEEEAIKVLERMDAEDSKFSS